MLKNIMLLMLVMCAGLLLAQPEYYPQTLIAEDFGATWCPSCVDANAGIDTLHTHFSSTEFISARYYGTSADLSNPWADARIAYYNATLFPTVIFNGTSTLVGGGENIANGSTYLNLLNPKRFSASPIKIAITNLNSNTGVINARVTMISSTYSIINQSITFLLVENNVTPTATHVVREVITQNISLTGPNNFVDCSATFTSIPPLTRPDYWAIALVQLTDHSIIQAASTIPQPTVQIRAAMPFSTTIIDSAGINYTSDSIWFYNLGQTTTFTMRLPEDNCPDGWYLNYCGEDGLCYPGFAPHSFVLQAGQAEGYHLNLDIGGSGTGTFHFIVEAAGMEPYIIPFTYQTSDTPNDDPALPIADLSLLQNYPNPFEQSTSFKLYSVKNAPATAIEIFNCKGQKVASLPTGLLVTGTTEISWDGKGKTGNQLAQGIYYYRLKNQASTPVKKLLILKNN